MIVTWAVVSLPVTHIIIEGHGHNYTVEVSLRGPTDVKTGMVVHLTEAKRIIDDNVIILFDHKNINEDVPYFKNVPSTCENVTVFIWDILVDKFSNLYEVKVSETEKNFFVYRGEKGT